MMKISQAKINAGKQVRNVRKTLKQIEHGRQDIQEELSEVYKPIVTAQEDVKQTIDEKQDKLIKQLQENQNNLIQAIEYDPTEALTYDGSKLPELDWDSDEGDEGDWDSDEGDEGDLDSDEGDEGDLDKPSTSQKKVGTLNINKGITTEYKKLLEDKGYELPSEIFNEKKMFLKSSIKYKSRQNALRTISKVTAQKKVNR